MGDRNKKQIKAKKSQIRILRGDGKSNQRLSIHGCTYLLAQIKRDQYPKHCITINSPRKLNFRKSAPSFATRPLKRPFACANSTRKLPVTILYLPLFLCGILNWPIPRLCYILFLRPDQITAGSFLTDTA
ncbi:hypothetical protein AFLA_003050 [Aspergillus flavus NRRL3357]|nr:hypothetical protein AFLA_003050 [Aspergillus flavus NRRL3357]